MSLRDYIQKNWLLLLILLVATTLRFWNFFEIPLTHDEVSALNRTHFDNFSDLINLGVKLDTHPPGVQVFTYFWVKAFGYEQWVVKLPFMLMGLGSLLLAYSIIKKWSNETVALLVISFMATMQFTVMYSQIARPYVSGLFLVLCMVYFWDQLVNHPEKHFWRNFILTAIFGAACGYNHHFSLLAAFIIGLTGVFVIDKKYLLKYLLMGVLIVLLYALNLPIFMHQLDRGGVGEWLGAPTPRFIIDFFSFIFNHSLALIAVFILIISIGIGSYQKGTQLKWVYISAIWFFSVWIIGYYYSVFRNPVLQFSMLLFFFPFLLHAMLGWIPELSKRTQAILVVMVLFVGTTSLTFHRKYYEVFYANRYFQMKADAAECDQDKTCYVFATYPHFLKIDFPRDIDFPTEYLAWEENVNTIKEFEEYVINCNKEQLFLGHVEQFPKELIAIAHHHYPNLLEVNYLNGAASYLFSKTGADQGLSYYSLDVLYHITLNADVQETVLLDGKSYNTTEWGIGSEIDLNDAIKDHYDILVIQATIKHTHPDDDILLVAEFPGKEGEEAILWSGKSAKDYIYQSNDSITHIISAISLDNVFRRKDSIPHLKTFIWNPKKVLYNIESYQVELWEGNRIKYCLWEDF